MTLDQTSGNPNNHQSPSYELRIHTRRTPAGLNGLLLVVTYRALGYGTRKLKKKLALILPAFYTHTLDDRASNHVSLCCSSNTDKNTIFLLFYLFVEVSAASRSQLIDTNLNHGAFVGHFMESEWWNSSGSLRRSPRPICYQLSAALHHHWHSIALCKVTWEGQLSRTISIGTDRLL